MKLLIKIAKSLRVRIFLILFATGFLSCMVMQYAILANYEKRAVDAKAAEVRTQLRILANHLISENYLQDPSSTEITSALQTLADLNDGRVLVIGEDLQIIADTYHLRVGKTMISEEIVRCLRGGNDSDMAVYDEENGYIEIITPVIGTRDPYGDEDIIADEGGGVVRGVMLTSVSAAPVKSLLDTLERRAYRIQMIVVLIIFFFALLAANGLLRPFDRVTKAISEIKAGYTDEPVSVPDYLETEHIVNAFNQLLSRMKALDDSRSEFVSNVSHELRTPITSMKVLADTLLSQGEEVPVEVYRDFMTDISSEIDREDKIINDLLSLVRLDKKAVPLNITSVNVNEMLEIVLKRLRPIARVRNIELTLESQREVTAHIDEVKTMLAIMNIVENAIKYNKDSGYVRVLLDADHQDFTVSVSDSGIGIPEDAIEHIYERFYRVDKSRSREIGGTGLGLSVARSAVLMHRGEIEVTSTEGEGTTFVIRMPLNYVSPEVTAKPVRKRRRLLPEMNDYRVLRRAKTLAWLLGIFATSSLVLCSCGTKQQMTEAIQDADAFLIYEVNSEETDLSTVPYEPEADVQDTEAMVDEVLLRLIPKKNALRGHTLYEGRLTLDFNAAYFEEDSVTKVLRRAGVVRTLTQIDGVDQVLYEQDGETLLDRSGMPVGSMNENTFIYSAGKEISTFDKVRVTLYFTDKTGKELVRVYRTVVYNSNISVERMALTQLIGGPLTEGVYPTLNPETELLNITVRDGVCYVDLDERFLVEPYDVAPKTAIYSVVNTLAEMTEVNKVQIYVDGDNSRRFMDQIPLTTAFERNLELIHSDN